MVAVRRWICASLSAAAASASFNCSFMRAVSLRALLSWIWKSALVRGSCCWLSSSSSRRAFSAARRSWAASR
ncbi:hypothetical protein V8C86DRAFT_2648226 [Haematococcus lacustris]